MRLLVTGGAGFIGSALTRVAISRGHHVINVDALTYAANLESLRSVENSNLYAFENVNICDFTSVQALFKKYKPEAVMHLAAESHVDRSIDGPGAFIQTNIIGTFNLLQAARGHWETLTGQQKDSFRFHHISTDEVYGDLSPKDPAFEETTSYNPSSPYSASKAASDHLVRAWGKTYGLPYLITNCSNNYGPYQFPEKLIPVVILKALHKLEIPVYGKGDNIRDWLYVDDHVDALLKVLEKGTPGETYNVGGDNELTNLDLVQTLCCLIQEKLSDRFDYSSLITFVADRPGHDRRYAVNANKINASLGWSPSIAFDEGFSKTLNWYIENEWWWRPLINTDQFEQRLGLKSASD